MRNLNPFIGRTRELEGLRGLLKKTTASLVVIRGRRRIGKSRLAEEFGRSFKHFYLLTGIPPEQGVTAQDQRDEFARQLDQMGIPVKDTTDWGNLFTDLALHCTKERVLIVLDEISWMGGLSPTFLPKLKTIWDTHLKKNPRLILLISGSNSSWIEENILNSTGFFGRISHQLKLEELPLNQCDQFWGAQRDTISPYEKFKVLAVTGGVPRYLEEVRSDLTAEQNLLSLCYQQSGILFHEFDQIFSDLFSTRNETYKKIINYLADQNATQIEIGAYVELSTGGTLSQYLDDMIEAGFLSKERKWNINDASEERLSYYRISDNYIRYFLKYITPYKDRILQRKIHRLPKGWKSIMGLQFENLVCKNGPSLMRILGINPDEVIWSGPYFQTPTTRSKGCQIDFLIQTDHNVLYVCEVKFSNREIPFSVAHEVREKVKRLNFRKGFSTRHVLIHVNGVSERLENDSFFSHIVDFGELLTVAVN